MKYIPGIALFVAFCLAGCNSKTPQPEPTEKLFADFYIRFLEPENQVKAEARFHKGDSLYSAKPVLIKGGVAFQNNDMGKGALPSGVIRYNYENFFSYPETFTFQFKNLEAKPQKQTIRMSPPGQFSVSPSVNKTTGGTLHIGGKPFHAFESLVVLLSDTNNKTVSWEVLPAGADIPIPVEKLAELQTGKIELYLVKKQTQKIENKHYAFTSTIEYYSESIAFELSE